MSTLPPGWVLSTLGELVTEVRNGIAAKPDQDDGLPILRISAVRPMRLDLTDVRYLPRDFGGAETYLLEANDLLFTRYNGNRDLVASCARVREHGAKVVYPDKLIRVRLDQSLARPAFVESAVHTLTARAFIADKLKSSAGQVGISGTDLKRLPIPLAPLREQKRIADKLDALLARVDTYRDRIDRVPSILKRFRQAVLAAATTGELTREWREEQRLDAPWPVVQLEGVATDFSYGSAAKSAKTGRVPVLRMGNIQGGMLDWEDLVFTSDLAEIRKYKLVAGDVLFNRTNSPELVGKTAVYRGEREAIYAGYLIRVRCGERLLPDYLNYCLGSPAGRDYCWQVKSDGVSQSNINAKKIAAFSFALPSVPEQHEIVRRVQEMLAMTSQLTVTVRQASGLADRLSAALLAKAFSGELVPQDPNDEPASALLDRIRRRPPSAGNGASRGRGDARRIARPTSKQAQ